MSKSRDEMQVIPPKGDGSNGKTTPVDGASKGSHVEQLSSELKQLKLQRKIDKIKEFKSHEIVASSSSNEETDASSEKEEKGKKEKKGNLTFGTLSKELMRAPSP
jgi:hypothetical protein